MCWWRNRIFRPGNSASHPDRGSFRPIGNPSRSHSPNRRSQSCNSLPGVESATAGWPGALLPAAYSNHRVRPTDGPADGSFTEISYRPVSPEFFETLGIPAPRGRNFDGADTSTSEAVAIVSESLARTLFGDADPLGQYVSPPGQGATERWQIVGVVPDIEWTALPDATDPPDSFDV